MSQRIPRYSSPVFLMFFLSLSHSSSFFSHIYGLTQLLLASNFLCSFEWLLTYDPPAFTSAGISGVYHHVQFHAMLGTELSWEVKQGRCALLGKHSIKCATPLAQVPPSYAGALPLSYSLHHPTRFGRGAPVLVGWPQAPVSASLPAHLPRYPNH